MEICICQLRMRDPLDNYCCIVMVEMKLGVKMIGAGNRNIY